MGKTAHRSAFHWKIIQCSPIQFVIIRSVITILRENLCLTRTIFKNGTHQYKFSFKCIRETPRNTYLTSLLLVSVRRPWTNNSGKFKVTFHFKCKLHFPGAQLMLRQIHLTDPSESIEATFFSFLVKFDAMKTALEFVILCSNR